MFDNTEDINAFLDKLLREKEWTLQELFDKKLEELQMTPTVAFKVMDVQSRTMKGILTGSQKLVDVRNLIKLSSFLQIPLEQVVLLFLNLIEKQFPDSGIPAAEIQFIKDNFDLAVLKKAGVIDSISDFHHIKRRVTARLGLRSIFEYKRPSMDVAFSSGLFKPENNNTRAFWISAALATLSEVSNPNPYNRDGLIAIFPKISWYSTNVERGLIEVSKLLYSVGITVIFQPSLQSLQLRGATFSHNGKPAIVLTNYRGFYATLWFCLIHELYHVLFDWSDIKANKYHISDDSNTQLSVQEREKEADTFAREYLFSSKSMDRVKPYINDAAYVKEVAYENNVDPSIIYVFYAFDSPESNRMAWARARKFSPDLNTCQKPVDLDWQDERLIEESIPQLTTQSYS